MYEYLGPASRTWIPCGHCHYMGALRSNQGHLTFQPSDAIAIWLNGKVRPLFFRFTNPLDGQVFTMRVVNKTIENAIDVPYKVVYHLQELTQLEILNLTNPNTIVNERLTDPTLCGTNTITPN